LTFYKKNKWRVNVLNLRGNCTLQGRGDERNARLMRSVNGCNKKEKRKGQKSIATGWGDEEHLGD